jgi:hypothetical protein
MNVMIERVKEGRGGRTVVGLSVKPWRGEEIKRLKEIRDDATFANAAGEAITRVLKAARPDAREEIAGIWYWVQKRGVEDSITGWKIFKY